MSMLETPLCPRCQIPMMKAAGLFGVWVCPHRADHEFMEESEKAGRDAASRWSPDQARAAEDILASANMAKRCPKCGAKAKQTKTGKWFCDNGEAHRSVYMIPAEGHWLEHIGIKDPLPPVPQANISDGGLCLNRGVIAPGGGSKNGRKRKKPEKRRAGPRQLYDF